MTHQHLINFRLFRVYFKGSYSLLEIDFGKRGRDFVIYLINTNCFIKIVNYRKLMKSMENCINKNGKEVM